MQHLFNERRSVLVQDIREMTSTLFPKLTEIYNQLLHKGRVFVPITEMYYWILCELTNSMYAYQIRGHNSKDTLYRPMYDEIRNAWNKEQFALERIFGFYVKGPALYVPCHDVDLAIAHGGADIIFTFYWNESEYRKFNLSNMH